MKGRIDVTNKGWERDENDKRTKLQKIEDNVKIQILEDKIKNIGWVKRV